MKIVIIYIALLGLIRLFIPSTSNNKKSFVIIAGSFLFLICVLRSVESGTDTLGYVFKYNLLSYISIKKIWYEFINYSSRDPFFYLFSKFISLSGANYRVWLSVIAAVFCFSVSWLIYKYSDEEFLSFVILFSLGYIYFSFTALRQILAISMLISSFKYLKERKVLPFIICVLLGTLFHSTSLIFLIAYPLGKIKISLKHTIVILAMFIIAYFFSDLFRMLIYTLGWSEYMASYAERNVALTISGLIIQGCIFVFCLYYKREVLDIDKTNLVLYNLLFLGLIFQIYSVVIAEMFRVSMYFSIFSIILIPKAINAEKNKHIKTMLYYVILLVLVSYIFVSNSYSGFRFFWQ